MKKLSLITSIILLATLATYAVINVVVTIPLSEAKYMDMQKSATNGGFLSVEHFFSNAISREVEGQRLSLLVTLWNNASETQREAAIAILKATPSP